MTTPSERTRNLVQTGAFLKELRFDDSLPKSIRVEALRLLRHYPTVSELVLLAQLGESELSLRLLDPHIDPVWHKKYRFGPHNS